MTLAERQSPSIDGALEALSQLIDMSGDCWEWTGYRDHYGYGGRWYQGRQWKAHALIYTLFVEPIPAGLEIDHLCKNRACVNPDHLEPVTHRTNLLRSRRDSCPHGHPLDGWRSPGHRYCLTCNRLRARKAARHD